MRTRLILFIPIIIFFCLRVVGTGRDMSNSDEARWHRRSANFLTAIKSGNYANTDQHYQPGVTLMWLSAFNLQIHKSYPYLENYDQYPEIRRNTQFLIISVLTVLLFIQLWVISKLYSLKLALVYGLLMSLEPYLLGIDRWVHLTSMETYFSFTAFLVFLYYLNRKNPIVLVFSGLLLALGVLSKLTALLMLPFFIALLLHKGKIKPAVIYLVSFVFFVLLFFPALWVSPLVVLQKLYSAIFNAVTDDVRSRYFGGFIGVIYYPLILAFKMSPVTFLLFILSFLHLRKVPVSNGYKVFYIAFFYILLSLTVSDKKIDRYSIILFPYVLFVVANYILKLSTRAKSFIFTVLGAFTFYTVVGLYPLYSHYYSPVFGGQPKALSLGIYENSGEFFADSAFFLNQFGRNHKVYIPDNFESFKYFYKGTSVREFSSDVDYVVSSQDFDRPLPRSEFCPNLLRSFGTVYVYKCSNNTPQ